LRIIFFAGASASGKTTIAERVAKELRFKLISEHQILHNIAKKHGFNRARDSLAIGINALLMELRFETAKQIESAKNGKGIILDGTYDRDLSAFLKQRFTKDSISIIEVSANKSLRRHRIIGRTGFSTKEALRELRFIDKMKQKAGASEVIRSADFKVRNKGKLDNAVEEIKNWIALTEKKEMPEWDKTYVYQYVSAKVKRRGMLELSFSVDTKPIELHFQFECSPAEILHHIPPKVLHYVPRQILNRIPQEILQNIGASDFSK